MFGFFNLPLTELFAASVRPRDTLAREFLPALRQHAEFFGELPGYLPT